MLFFSEIFPPSTWAAVIVKPLISQLLHWHVTGRDLPKIWIREENEDENVHGGSISPAIEDLDFSCVEYTLSALEEEIKSPGNHA